MNPNLRRDADQIIAASLAAVFSVGSDGPTVAAGGYVDSETAAPKKGPVFVRANHALSV